MKTIKLTPQQAQQIVFMAQDGPTNLGEWAYKNEDDIYLILKKTWDLKLTNKELNWLKKELKDYILFMKEEIKSVKELDKIVDEYWIEEAKEHKRRIFLCNRIIEKLLK